MDNPLPQPSNTPEDLLKEESLPELDKEELQSAKEVLLQLTKTAKTLKIYLPNNPIYQKFLQELQVRLDSHLQDFEVIRLSVRQYELHYKGRPVYENSNRVESLAFKLYADGIRELTFLEGIEKEEITTLLEVVGRDYDPINPDDDLVTLLWEKNFPHIRYMVAEDGIQEALPGAFSQGASPPTMNLRSVGSSVRAAAAAPPNPVDDILGPHLSEGITQIFVLTIPEVARIKQQMNLEDVINPITVLVGILTSILRIEKEEAAFSETVEILENVLETLTLRGDFWHAAKLLEFFRDLMGPETNLPDFKKERLLKAIDRLGEPERIRELEPILNQGAGIDSEQLLQFWLLLTPNAISPLTDLLGRLTQMKIRRVVCEALIVLAKDSVDSLARKLDDPRWYVVRNVIYILGKIGGEDLSDRLRKVVHHKEIKVRKELINTLEGKKDSRTMELLMSLAQDPEESIRVMAIRTLARQQHLPALGHLEKIIEEKAFLTRDFSEKKEIFDAIGRLGGSKVVPLLKKFVKKGGTAWLKKGLNEEAGLCAIMALKRVGTQDALATLQEGQKWPSKIIREACRKALAEMERLHGGTP